MARNSQRPEFVPQAMAEAGDRHPPHSNEAEQGTLGCVLLDPAACIPAVLARVDGASMGALDRPLDGSGLFYDMQHEALFRVCRTLWEEKGTLETIVLGQRLRDWNQLDQIGGMPYLAALMNAVPSAASLPYYLDILWEKFLLRKAVATGTRMVQEVFDGEGEIERVIGGIERQMEDFKETVGRNFGVRPQVLQRAGHFGDAALNRFLRKEQGLPGWKLPFPFPIGFRKGEMSLVSGDNGSGKTSLLSHIVIEAARQIQASVEATKEERNEAGFGPEDRICVASFEMSPDVSVWMALRQALGRERLSDGERGIFEFGRAIAWLNKYVWFHDFLGIGNWRDVLDAFRYARDHEHCRFFQLDSVMRVGIPEDDLTQQSVAAAEFASFTMEKDKPQTHLQIVGHENKAGVGAKNKVQGSKRWTDNAHLILQVVRNEAKGEKVADFWEELKAARKAEDEANCRRLEKLIEEQRAVWDTKVLLHKQRYPGAPQNGSAHLFFDRGSLQFRKHLEEGATVYV